MADQNGSAVEEVQDEAQADPWAAAFAALEREGEEAAPADPGESGGPGESPEGADGQQGLPDQPQIGDGEGSQGEPGEPGAVPGEPGGQVGEADGGPDVDEAYIKQYRDQVEERVRERSIKEVAEEFVKRGVRNVKGKLGATLDDADICKRDEDGVPRFYNPETGREFTGDNPRRQAQEWVDDYNKELARVFNEACAKYEEHLMEQEAPAIAVLEFAPKYEKLDPIRKAMLDNVLQDYEITGDDGSVTGYTCDLDKALALVERQVAAIQGYAKEHGQQQKAEPTGPALDMKTSSGAIPSGEQAAPASLAEAMERQQDALLAKMKK